MIELIKTQPIILYDKQRTKIYIELSAEAYDQISFDDESATQLKTVKQINHVIELANDKIYRFNIDDIQQQTEENLYQYNKEVLCLQFNGSDIVLDNYLYQYLDERGVV